MPGTPRPGSPTRSPPGVTVVIADLTATRFYDSTALKHLLQAGDKATRAATQLRLAIAPDGPIAQAGGGRRRDPHPAILAARLSTGRHAGMHEPHDGQAGAVADRRVMAGAA
jgi:hypothetical protein